MTEQPNTTPESGMRYVSIGDRMTPEDRAVWDVLLKWTELSRRYDVMPQAAFDDAQLVLIRSLRRA